MLHHNAQSRHALQHRREFAVDELPFPVEHVNLRVHHLAMHAKGDTRRGHLTQGGEDLGLKGQCRESLVKL